MINLLSMTHCESNFIEQLATFLNAVLSLHSPAFPFSLCHSHSYLGGILPFAYSGFGDSRLHMPGDEL